MTPLEELPHEPFGLASDPLKLGSGRLDVDSSRGGALSLSGDVEGIATHWFDGAFLASFLVSSGRFMDPVNRRALDRSECVRLDAHLEANGLPLVQVVRAFDLALNASGQDSLAVELEREAASVLRWLFNFRHRSLPPPPMHSPPPRPLGHVVNWAALASPQWGHLGLDTPAEPACEFGLGLLGDYESDECYTPVGNKSDRGIAVCIRPASVSQQNVTPKPCALAPWATEAEEESSEILDAKPSAKAGVQDMDLVRVVEALADAGVLQASSPPQEHAWDRAVQGASVEGVFHGAWHLAQVLSRDGEAVEVLWDGRNEKSVLPLTSIRPASGTLLSDSEIGHVKDKDVEAPKEACETEVPASPMNEGCGGSFSSLSGTSIGDSVDSNVSHAGIASNASDASNTSNVNAKVLSPVPVKPEDERLFGRIKSYNRVNGFGFIVCDTEESDIWFSKADLRVEHQSTSRPGDPVTFFRYWGPYEGNLQARRVEPASEASVAKPRDEVTLAEGRLKSYNPIHGFGFIACSGMPTDVWFSRDEIATDEKLLVPGAVLKYELYLSPESKPRARRVQPKDEEAKDGKESHAEGYLKSYSSTTGYGFIACKAVQGDVWFTREEVHVDNHEALQVGAFLRFKLEFSPDGRPRARSVQPKRGTATNVASSKSGRVKSYNPAKGYGFIRCKNVQRDVWFTRDELTPENQGFLSASTIVNFELIWAPDGKPRARNVRRAPESDAV